MEQEILQSGWKRLTSDTANDYLYRARPVKNMGDGLNFLTAVTQLATTAKLDTTTHLSLDAKTVTISLNSPADTQLTDEHFKLAQQINQVK